MGGGGGGGGASAGVSQQPPQQPPHRDSLATPTLVPLPDESPQSDPIPPSSTAALLPPTPTPSASAVPPPSQEAQVRIAVSSTPCTPRHPLRIKALFSPPGRRRVRFRALSFSPCGSGLLFLSFMNYANTLLPVCSVPLTIHTLIFVRLMLRLVLSFVFSVP